MPARFNLFRSPARLWRNGALAALGLLLTACGGLPGPLSSARLGDLEPPPALLPASTGGAGDALLGGASFSIRDPGLDWGDGVLRPIGADAFDRIDLALFDGPGGRHWGWLTQGRVYDQTRRRSLPDRTDATLIVSGGRALLVLEARSDGWLKIRYGHPEDRDGGVAWTRESLAAGRRASFQPWERVLSGAQGLIFRNSDAAHNLRDGPSTSAAVIERLEGENFDMTMLEIRDNWMRVRVTEPPACAGSVARDLLLGGVETRVRTGWIAWRSADRGPWVMDAAGPRCSGGA